MTHVIGDDTVETKDVNIDYPDTIAIILKEVAWE